MSNWNLEFAHGQRSGQAEIAEKSPSELEAGQQRTRETVLAEEQATKVITAWEILPPLKPHAPWDINHPLKHVRGV